MKTMQPASARALTGMAALVLLVGLMVMSPSAAFLAFCLAALLSAIPAIFGTGKTRLIAAALLLGAAVLAVNRYQDFRREQERYRQKKPTASQRADGARVAWV
jgi:membrane protein implicated in regulation of membrane protease activity